MCTMQTSKRVLGMDKKLAWWRRMVTLLTHKPRQGWQQERELQVSFGLYELVLTLVGVSVVFLVAETK